jgi:hypothetical protein
VQQAIELRSLIAEQFEARLAQEAQEFSAPSF